MTEQLRQYQENVMVPDAEGLPTSEDGQDDGTQLYYPLDEELALINQAGVALLIGEEVGSVDFLQMPEEPETPPPTDEWHEPDKFSGRCSDSRADPPRL